MRISAIAVGGLLLLAGCTDADWSQSMTRLGLQGEPSNAAPSRWLTSSRDGEGASSTRHATPAALVSHASVSDVRALSPAPQAGADDFCAASARQDADGSEFDAPTRERIYQARLLQCRMLVAR
jgi:hypothetical protein